MIVKESGFSTTTAITSEENSSSPSGSGRLHRQFNQENHSNHQKQGQNCILTNDNGSAEDECYSKKRTLSNITSTMEYDNRNGRKPNGNGSAGNRTLEMNSHQNNKKSAGLSDLVGEVEQDICDGVGVSGGNRNSRKQERRRNGICDVIEAQLEHLGKGYVQIIEIIFVCYTVIPSSPNTI
jgi:hypothetical protein